MENNENNIKIAESWDELIPVLKKCLKGKKENIFADALNTMNKKIVHKAIIDFMKTEKLKI